MKLKELLDLLVKELNVVGDVEVKIVIRSDDLEVTTYEIKDVICNDIENKVGITNKRFY